jgi:hypothetical protein
VPPVSGARGGVDNSCQVGATSRGEAAAALRSRGSMPWRCGRGGGGEEGQRKTRWRGRHARGAAKHGHGAQYLKGLDG